MSEKKKTFFEHLRPYLAIDEAADFCAALCAKETLQLRIASKRQTLQGDYRPPAPRTPYHRISINHDLNPQSFLVTLLHELAHLHTFKKHKNRVEPHGKAWQNHFTLLLKEALSLALFPEALISPIKGYMADMKAATFRNKVLQDALHQFDPPKPEGWIMLSSLQAGDSFVMEDGRRFTYVEPLRKNFRCTSLDDQRAYRVNPQSYVRRIKLKSLQTPIITKSADTRCFLEELPHVGFFSTDKGLTLQKKERLRTNYKCLDPKSGKWYKAPGRMLITPIQPSKS